MESVHVLVRMDGHQDLFLIYVFGQWELYNIPVNTGIFIQLIDKPKQFFLCSLIRQLFQGRFKTNTFTGPHLASHIGKAGTIVAN